MSQPFRGIAAPFAAMMAAPPRLLLALTLLVLAIAALGFALGRSPAEAAAPDAPEAVTKVPFGFEV